VWVLPSAQRQARLDGTRHPRSPEEGGHRLGPRKRFTALPAVIFYCCWSTVAPRELRESNT